MDISNAINSAFHGLQVQQQRLQRNVNEVASIEPTSARDSRTQDRALVEQIEIISSFQANARSLQAASERIGTLLDVKV